jgi:hypothetical protein
VEKKAVCCFFFQHFFFESDVIVAAQGDHDVWYCGYCHHENPVNEMEMDDTATSLWFKQFLIPCDGNQAKQFKKKGAVICYNVSFKQFTFFDALCFPVLF